MTLKVGKLYSCSEYYLMLYPDEITARAADFATSPARAAALAAYWSEEFGKPVSYININEPFLVLCTTRMQTEVLVEDKRGWIQIGHYPGDNRWDIKEIVYEAA